MRKSVFPAVVLGVLLSGGPAQAFDVGLSRAVSKEISFVAKQCDNADCVSSNLRKKAGKLGGKPDYRKAHSQLNSIARQFKKCKGQCGTRAHGKLMNEITGLHSWLSASNKKELQALAPGVKSLTRGPYWGNF